MSKMLILIVGIVWASLLLISWGGAEDLAQPSAPAAVSSKNR